MISEPIVLAIVSGAIGWIVRHVGVGAGIGSRGVVSPARTVPAVPASITGGIRAEIESIVADAVKTAVATALADLRASAGYAGVK